jgi:ribosomal-protein-alanine N-acetyltransferase
MEWAIRTDQRAFIGWVTLGVHHNQVDTEISYLLLPEAWGQGYAREAVERVLCHGHRDLGLSRIVAETQTANASSVRLLERVGMTFERHLERFGASQSLYAHEAWSGL